MMYVAWDFSLRHFDSILCILFELILTYLGFDQISCQSLHDSSTAGSMTQIIIYPNFPYFPYFPLNAAPNVVLAPMERNKGRIGREIPVLHNP